MDLDLKGQVAVVLASSSGLGLAVAQALLEEGASVAISGRERERLHAALEPLLARHGERVMGSVLDVTQAAALAQHLADVRARFGALHALVLNAGGPPPASAAEVSDEQLARAYELSFLSAVHAVRTALPWMRAQRHGRIVAMSSISVKQPIAGLATSNALRAALWGWLKTLADEVGRDGITVNNVLTGSFATERLASLFAARAQRSARTVDEERARAVGEIPLGRLGDPKELASLVAFLCSRRASFVHGAAIACDGGALRAS